MGRIYLGKLPRHTRERDIERFFHGFGRIKEIALKQGYAFVELYDNRDSDDAVYELNGKILNGERVTVENAKRREGYRGYGYTATRPARPPLRRGAAPARTQYRLNVFNLSTRCHWMVRMA